MAQLARKMTREEYLALPMTDGEKIEWVNGECYAMSGGRPRHSLVSANVIRALGNSLAGSPCSALSSDQRVAVVETDALFFPDATVVCPPWEMLPSDVQSVANPVVIVEVPSPSIQQTDLNDKPLHYRRIPSLRHLLIVHLGDRIVTHYERTETGWTVMDIREGCVPLSALDVELPLADVFDNIDSLPDV